MSKSVSIIDGNNLFRRCFHAACDVKNFSKSLKGVLNPFLLMRINSLKNRRVIVTFDTCKSEKRLALLPEYKGHRKSSMTPEQQAMMSEVFPAYIDICRKSGLSVLDGDGYEADDYIAILAFMLRTNHCVTIISTDGDFPQLIDDRISVYNPNLKITITPENFENIFGFKRKYYLDYKCMDGDTSDNIDGIKKVGKKTAVKYICEYGTYEEICHELQIKKDATKKKELGVVEENILAASKIIATNRQLMDLSLVKTDMILRGLVKQKIQATKPFDRGLMFKTLSGYGIGEMIKDFDRCK